MRREIDRDATVTSHFASSRTLSSFPGKALRPRYPCEYRTSQRYAHNSAHSFLIS
ncbi:hypothetical protein ALC60_03603 [Trachymyrmex zeteki]|uniref:Uncharacterized protein n=1 Tax=Mycetomoellerius zeteki TaxID=64791 RepID=A0A151XB86_9HYME|nr:hypothetical protein ALC60_03603 [Trachymyrmex zeteki]